MARRHLPKCEDFDTPIPPGLPDLLQDISQRVLKGNPINIYCYVADYLSKLLNERNGDGESHNEEGLIQGPQSGGDDKPADSLRRRLSALQNLVQNSVELGTKFAEKYRRAGELHLIPQNPAEPDQYQDEDRLNQRLNVLSNLLTNIEQRVSGEKTNAGDKGENDPDFEAGQAMQIADKPTLDADLHSAESLDRLICQEVQGLLAQVRNMSEALAHAQKNATAIETLGAIRDQMSVREQQEQKSNKIPKILSTDEANWIALGLLTGVVDEPCIPEMGGDSENAGNASAKLSSGIELQGIDENHEFATVSLHDVGANCSAIGAKTVEADGAAVACEPIPASEANIEFSPPPDQLPVAAVLGELPPRDRTAAGIAELGKIEGAEANLGNCPEVVGEPADETVAATQSSAVEVLQIEILVVVVESNVIQEMDQLTAETEASDEAAEAKVREADKADADKTENVMEVVQAILEEIAENLTQEAEQENTVEAVIPGAEDENNAKTVPPEPDVSEAETTLQAEGEPGSAEAEAENTFDTVETVTEKAEPEKQDNAEAVTETTTVEGSTAETATTVQDEAKVQSTADLEPTVALNDAKLDEAGSSPQTLDVVQAQGSTEVSPDAVVSEALKESMFSQILTGDRGLYMALIGTGVVALAGYGAVKGYNLLSSGWSTTPTLSPLTCFRAVCSRPGSPYWSPTTCSPSF